MLLLVGCWLITIIVYLQIVIQQKHANDERMRKKKEWSFCFSVRLFHSYPFFLFSEGESLVKIWCTVATISLSKISDFVVELSLSLDEKKFSAPFSVVVAGFYIHSGFNVLSKYASIWLYNLQFYFIWFGYILCDKFWLCQRRSLLLFSEMVMISDIMIYFVMNLDRFWDFFHVSFTCLVNLDILDWIYWTGYPTVNQNLCDLQLGHWAYDLNMRPFILNWFLPTPNDDLNIFIKIIFIVLFISIFNYFSFWFCRYI